MKLIIFNLALISYFIYSISRIKRQLHMLQLNSYMNSRYIKWYGTNVNKELSFKELVPLVVTIFLFANNFIIWAVLWIIIYVIFFLTKGKSLEKKKFVVTSRVKRLITTIIIINLIIAVSLNCLYLGQNLLVAAILLCILVIFNLSGFLLILIANSINYPMESMINRWYYNSAKKIIENMNRLTIIGITGSYGKTSTKYILSKILMEKFNVLMTPESYNTTMGVIKTIRTMLKPVHEVFIVEMGAKKKGDIKEICDLVSPRFGLLTSIGPQHLESFKSIDNIISTKFELAQNLIEGGVSFLNYENEYIKGRKVSRPHITYGIENKSLNYWAENIHFGSDGAVFTFCSANGQRKEFKTRLLGTHNILNIVAASSIACELGMEIDTIAFAVKLLQPIPHRLEFKKLSNNVAIIDDAFNSNPEGAKAAVEVLSKFDGFNKVLITPGMVELGDMEYKCNKEFGESAAKVCDFIILVGPKQTVPIQDGIRSMNYPEDKLYVAKNLNDALSKMRMVAAKDSVVLLENDLPDNYNE